MQCIEAYSRTGSKEESLELLDYLWNLIEHRIVDKARDEIQMGAYYELALLIYPVRPENWILIVLYITNQLQLKMIS